MPIKFAEQLRLIIKGPAGGRFPSNHLPKQHVEEAPGPFHLAQHPCMHLSFTESLGYNGERHEPRHWPS